ncbi:MAG: hypothetical protein KGZ25_11685, partial [Planctomycetes bacterium]|nr:hypothetical protein [Planctomycetota bacterium]
GDQENSVPDWAGLIPHRLQYGVPSEELIWAMSLGVQDRSLATWLVSKFESTNHRKPSSCKELVSWTLKSEKAILRFVEQNWPRYFAKLLSESLMRYRRILDVLEYF